MGDYFALQIKNAERMEGYYRELLRAVLEEGNSAAPQNLAEDIQAGIRYGLSTLEVREQELLWLRLGCEKSWEEISGLWQTSLGYVQNMEIRALQKLREPPVLFYIKQGVDGYLRAVQRKAKAAGYQQGYQEGYADGLSDGKKKDGQETVEESVRMLPIECLGLTKRSRNNLVRAGCLRIGDLLDLNTEQIHFMKNVGEGTAAEVSKGLQTYGIYHTLWDSYARGILV